MSFIAVKTVTVKNSTSRQTFIDFIFILEDRGAQAPLILAPAEGFRGPSAPFGGLRPLLWGLRPLPEAYGLSQYHQ